MWGLVTAIFKYLFVYWWRGKQCDKAVVAQAKAEGKIEATKEVTKLRERDVLEDDRPVTAKDLNDLFK